MAPNRLRTTWGIVPIMQGVVAFVVAALSLSGHSSASADAGQKVGLAPEAWSKRYGDSQNTCRGLGSGATGVIKYTVPLSKICSWGILSPDGFFYAGSMWGDLIAIDVKTGVQKGQIRRASSIDHAASLGANGVLYIQSGKGSTDGELFAIDAKTGADRWTYKTHSMIGSPPAVGKDGTVYAMSWTNDLFALDGSSGQLKWHVKTPWSSCSPAIGPDGSLYVGGNNDDLNCFNAKTGTLKWSRNFLNSSIAAPAIGDDGTVYVRTQRYVVAVNGATGDTKWKFDCIGSPKEPPAIGYDGNIYFGTGNGKVYGVNGRTGAQLWMADLGLANFGDSSAIDAKGVLYLASLGMSDTNIYAVDTTTGKVLWKVKPNLSGCRNPILGPDGTLYLISATSELVAIH